MALKIKEIKQVLNENKSWFSEKNNVSINEIKTSEKYWFNCENGHEIFLLPQYAIQEDGLHCKYCLHPNLRVDNTIESVRPDLIPYLVNIDDKKLPYSSNEFISWKCPNCNATWKTSPNRMNKRKNICIICGNNGSYPELFIDSFLSQLAEIYHREAQFDWLEGKKYDFYLPLHNMIIEAHGKQHYSTSFEYKGGRSLWEEQQNDEIKMEAAIKNGISEYVVINCSKSEKEFIKNNILSSILPTLLYFKSDDVDWELCDKDATKNITKEICDEYKSGLSINELTLKFKKNQNTIRTHLKKGTSFGWCDYNPVEEIEKAHKESGERVVQTMSKKVCQLDLNDNIIKIFNSLQEAQRNLKISHIWDVIIGKRKTAGGFKWKYLE